MLKFSELFTKSEESLLISKAIDSAKSQVREKKEDNIPLYALTKMQQFVTISKRTLLQEARDPEVTVLQVRLPLRGCCCSFFCAATDNFFFFFRDRLPRLLSWAF